MLLLKSSKRLNCIPHYLIARLILECTKFQFLIAVLLAAEKMFHNFWHTSRGERKTENTRKTSKRLGWKMKLANESMNEILHCIYSPVHSYYMIHFTGFISHNSLAYIWLAKSLLDCFLNHLNRIQVLSKYDPHSHYNATSKSFREIHFYVEITRKTRIKIFINSWFYHEALSHKKAH